jgi:hypothetical protein
MLAPSFVPPLVRRRAPTPLALSFASVVKISNPPCLAAPPNLSCPRSPVRSSALPVKATADAAP